MEQAAPRRNVGRSQEHSLDRRQQNAQRPMEWPIWMQQMPAYTPDINPYPALGMAGIVKQNAIHCNIVSVKIAAEGRSDVFTATTALRDVIDEHNLYKRNRNARPRGWRGSVINMSYSYGDFTWHPDVVTLIESVLQDLENAGIPISFSAGNYDNDRTHVGCSYPTTVCVAACDIHYARWVSPPEPGEPREASNYGPDVNIIAPGVDIQSADFETNDRLHTESGTSMAAASVAGVMAIFVGHEKIRQNAAKVRNLLYRNALQNIPFTGFPQGTTTRLVNTGIRASYQPPLILRRPYFGAPPFRVP
ncbi:MAG: hypothetical protein Q9160_003364 [Pyrenula sp. 1 TL-2023]